MAGEHADGTWATAADPAACASTPSTVGDLSTAQLATHSVSLDKAPRACDLSRQKTDGCVRAVIRPNG